jgi:hypothetical protein
MSAQSASATSTPEMTVIILTADSIDPIRKAVTALSRQTAQSRLELIIVCPDEDELGITPEELPGFHSVKILGFGRVTNTSKARAAAIRLAKAPVVALAEDHAYPEPGWAEALIDRHKEPWATVGPAFINANPGIVSWVALAVDYGRWVEPVTSREIDDLPGHNSSWKRDLLLEYDADLEHWLTGSTFLNWDLSAKGHKHYHETAAKVRHLQVSKLGPCLFEQFNVARLFPARRSHGWPWYRRMFYVAGMPVLLARNFRTWLGHLRRIDPSLPAKTFPMLLLMAVVWGAGEIVGYTVGIGRAEEDTLKFDTNRAQFVNTRDRELVISR